MVGPRIGIIAPRLLAKLYSQQSGYTAIQSVRNGREMRALICTCFGVSEQTIESEIKAGGLRTIAEVTRVCNAGAGCRSCYSLIEDILETVNSK